MSPSTATTAVIDARLDAIDRLLAALADAPSVDAVVAAAVPLVVEAVTASAGAIAACVEGGDAIELLGTTGYAPGVLAEVVRVPVMASLPVSDVLRTHAPVYLRTLGEWRATYAMGPLALGDRTDGAWAALPLRRGPRLLGVLTLSFAAPRPFAPDERRFLEVLATTCAWALDAAGIASAAPSGTIPTATIPSRTPPSATALAGTGPAERMRLGAPDVRPPAPHHEPLDDPRPAEPRQPAEEAAVRAALELMPQLVWTTTPDGYHDYYNAQWYRYTGMPRPDDPAADAEGWNWTSYLHPDDCERTLTTWQHCLATGSPYEIEYRFREAATGAYRWFLGRAQPLRDAAGQIVRWFGTCTDIDAQRRDAEALRAASAELQIQHQALTDAYARLQAQAVELEEQSETLHEQAAELEAQTAELEQQTRAATRARARAETAERTLREVFRQAPAFIAVLRGPDHVFELTNAAYDRLVGRRDLVGRPVREALPEIEGQGFVALLDEVLATGATHVGTETAVQLRDADGALQEHFVTFLYQALTDAEGTRTGVFVHGVDVTTQVRARQDAEAEHQRAEDARAAAHEANVAKANFLATMSHELRTPLNAISGYVQLLDMGLHGPLSADQRHALERIDRAQRHLLGVINDLLNFAKLEAGAIAYDMQRVTVADVLAAAAALVAPQLAAKGLVYHVEGADPGTDGGTALHVWADREKLLQVVLNLLSNAVKFTPAGGTVRLTVVEDPAAETVRLRVADSGPGIPVDKLEAVFEPFVQVHQGPSTFARAIEGTGLGLAISRDLARGMGGDLSAESPPGTGALLTVTLRRAD